MANCSPTNNPNQRFCPTPSKRFADLGGRNTGSFSHDTNLTITLTLPTGSREIFRSHRKSGMSWNQYSVATDAISCAWPLNSSGYSEGAYFAASTYDTEPYTCNFRDKNTIVDNEILFLDLRHNILVRKETTHEYTKSADSDMSSMWNQYGGAVKVHKIVPGDLEIMEYQKIYLNDELIDSKKLANYSENPYTFAVPPMSGVPQGNSQSNGKEDIYYIWDNEQGDDGGKDLYYPAWVRDISTVATPFELKNRDRHRALSGVSPYERSPYSGPLTTFDELVSVPTRIAGAWAVSPLKDESDNNLRAYSTLKLDNITLKNSVIPTTEADKLYDYPQEIPWPITPL